MNFSYEKYNQLILNLLYVFRLSLHKREYETLAIPTREDIPLFPLQLKKIYLWIMKILVNFYVTDGLATENIVSIKRF